MSSQGRTTTLENGLTPKQEAFKQEVIKQIQAGNPPNATEAAMQTYDAENRRVAQNIGSGNLSNPIIKKSIQDELAHIGLSREKLLENVSKIATLEVPKASAETVLKSNLELLKLITPRTGTGGTQINIMNISFAEARKQLETINGETGEFFEEAE